MLHILLVILLFSVWSSVFPIGKIALEYSPPFFLTAIRMLLSGILLIFYLVVRKRFSLKLKGKEWLSLGMLALFSIYLTNILEFWGLQYLSAAKTCFIYSLTPFFAALLSFIHFKEKMTPKKWLGLTIGFLGMIPVFIMQTGKEDLFQIFSYLSLPTLAIIGATFFSVYGWILLRVIVKDHQISPLYANGCSMLIGGAFALFHSLFFETWNPLPVSSGNFLPLSQSLLLLTFISNILCYNLYGYLLKRFTATFLSFMGLLICPLFASLNSWVLLGEVPSIKIFFSTALVALGLWVVYSEELKQGYFALKKI